MIGYYRNHVFIRWNIFGLKQCLNKMGKTKDRILRKKINQDRKIFDNHKSNDKKNKSLIFKEQSRLRGRNGIVKAR